MKATVLARSSGASEIGIDELLNAFTTEFAPNQPIASNPGFVPIPKYDVPLSPAAATAIASAGDLETVSLEQLRTALLNARGRA